MKVLIIFAGILAGYCWGTPELAFALFALYMLHWTTKIERAFLGMAEATQSLARLQAGDADPQKKPEPEKTHTLRIRCFGHVMVVQCAPGGWTVGGKGTPSKSCPREEGAALEFE